MTLKLAGFLLLGVPAFLNAGRLPSGAAIAISANSSIFGAPVTLTAVVNPPTAGGSVTFYNRSALLGSATLSAGQGALTTILLPPGSNSVRAYYSGDSNYAPSTSLSLPIKIGVVPGGRFQSPINTPTGVYPESIVVADFNGDNKADVAVANGGQSYINVFLGNGDGTLHAAANVVVGFYPDAVASGDFNGDGIADLVVGTNALTNNLAILLGNGDGTFRNPAIYATGIGFFPVAIAVGDFNGDGRADVVTANQSNDGSNQGSVTVFLGNADGTFQQPVNFAQGVDPYAIATGDFNGDGIADLVTANTIHGNITVLLGRGDGTFQIPVNYPAGGPYSVVIGDFNGDGIADIATPNGELRNVSVLLGKGDGTFQAAVTSAVPEAAGYPYSISTGDFDGDGRLDLATGNYSNTVSALFGRGDGTFPTVLNFPAGSTSGPVDALRAIAVADFNNDGRADIVTANTGINSLSVLLAEASAPQLSVAVTNSATFTQGETASMGAAFTITVSNLGGAPSTGLVTVSDSLSVGLSAASIGGAGWSCLLTTLSCTRSDTLAPLASYPAITLTVNVAANAPAGVTNTASVSGGGLPATITATDFTTTFTSAQIAQAWSALTPPASLTAADAALLMTNGTVMVHQVCSSNWYLLAPDRLGNYANGTWSQASSMPAGYAPADFSSAVLADGRLVVIGGEYNAPCNAQVESNLGAIYDPVSNVWTVLAAPAGWMNVGDSSNAVLGNGKFLLAGL